MIDFRSLEIDDKEWVNELFSRSNFQSEEYSFSFQYIWRKVFNVKLARINDYVVFISDTANPSYLYPAGSGDVKTVIDMLIEDAESRNTDLKFHTILGESSELLNEMYPDMFEYKELRDYADYIYDARSLETLTGKKLHPKRNHINKFIVNNPDWTYEPITKDNIEECYLMSKEWCRQVGCNSSLGLKSEACAVREAFANFFELKLEGGLLRVGGSVIAYTVADRLNSDTYLVHIEKAFAEIQGAYPMINQQLIINNGKEYTYINREDDMGEEGLRRAKLSYNPLNILDKREAVYKGVK